MFTIKYQNGKRQVYYNYLTNKPELELAIACYADNYSEVLKILTAYPEVDVNAAVMHSKSRGNGTPLVLTGSKAIAQLLVKYGALVNHSYNPVSDKIITPLDSAIKELTKLPVRTNPEKTAQIKELILYLKSKGAKQSKDL